MHYNVLAIIFSLAVILVGGNYIYAAKKKSQLINARVENNFKEIWKESFESFDFQDFMRVWNELSSLMELPPSKVHLDDTIEFICSISSSKELLLDEVERYLVKNMLDKQKIDVSHSFGSLVRIKLLNDVMPSQLS